MAKSRLVGLMEQSSPYKMYIEKEIPVLENLVEYYNSEILIC